MEINLIQQARLRTNSAHSRHDSKQFMTSFVDLIILLFIFLFLIFVLFIVLSFGAINDRKENKYADVAINVAVFG